MSRYFDWTASLKRFVRFDAARAEDVNDALDELTAGLGDLDGDVDRAIKLPDGSPDQVLSLASGQRANMSLGFDASGNVTAFATGGRYRGDWATATDYLVGDFFRDASTKNIYAASLAHTSAVLVDDIAAGKVRLSVNVADVEAAKLAAQAAESGATAQAGVATAQAVIATQQADAARAIANFVGIWGTLTGPLSKPATTYHSGRFWVLVNSLSDVTASEPGVSADWLESSGGGIGILAYESRGDLRAMTPADGAMAVVKGVGLFVWLAGSDEPDDDESCFATSTGRWLLEAASWDLVDTWQLPDDEARDAYDEDEPARFASSFASKVLTGTATCSITSVSTTASTSFDGTVTGAAVGDRVIATPPANLGATNADTARLSYHAWVSAANTVTVMLTNASVAAATTNTAIRTAWPITVIKS